MKEARKLPCDWQPYDKEHASYPICRGCVSLGLFDCQLVGDFRIGCILIWAWAAHQQLVFKKPHCREQMPFILYFNCH